MKIRQHNEVAACECERSDVGLVAVEAAEAGGVGEEWGTSIEMKVAPLGLGDE